MELQEAPWTTPLRRRMIDDMRMRKLGEKTQTAYIRAVRKLAAFLGRSPDTATAEDLRRFRLHLVETGVSPITLNATITALSVAYGAGRRASELISLKVVDVDGKRMTLRVEQGKGCKDRHDTLSAVLLERFRARWRVGRAQGKLLTGGWLFPGMDPTDPLTARQLNRCIHAAALAAWIGTAPPGEVSSVRT